MELSADLCVESLRQQESFILGHSLFVKVGAFSKFKMH